MSLEAKLTQLAVAVGTDVKTLNDRLGLNANLTTTQKTTIVGAINEIVANIGDMTLLKRAPSYSAPASIFLEGLGKTLVLTDSDEAGVIKYYGYKAADDSVWGIVRYKSTIVSGSVIGSVDRIITTDAGTYGNYSTMWANRATFQDSVYGGGEDPNFKPGEVYSTIVAAVLEALDAGNIAASLIDDTAGDGITNKTWSANKIYDSILASINQLRDDLVNGAGSALDTLKELADALGNDANFATTIADGLAKRVRVDAVQTFTNAEKLQGRENINAASETEFQALKTDLGDVTHDFLADYTTARDLMV